MFRVVAPVLPCFDFWDEREREMNVCYVMLWMMLTFRALRNVKCCTNVNSAVMIYTDMNITWLQSYSLTEHTFPMDIPSCNARYDMI